MDNKALRKINIIHQKNKRHNTDIFINIYKGNKKKILRIDV